MARDPVCGMEVDEAHAIKLEKDGKTYYFCSEHCRDAFLGKARRGGGHSSHHAHMLEDFKKRFIVSLFATIPVLILSPLVQSLFRFSLTFPGDIYIVFLLSTFIYFYGGWPFHKGLFDELKEKLPGMMTLIALAISIAYFYSVLVVLGLKGEVFFFELVTLIDIMLLGHFIEMRSVMSASAAFEELAKLLPSEAHMILKDGSVKDVRVEDLKKKDEILVRPGEKIPTDGDIFDGDSDVNETMITGESRPIDKMSGDRVIAGSINGTGSLKIIVTAVGKDSYLSGIIELVRKASESKSRVQDLANRAAFWLTIVAIGGGVLTLVSWLALGQKFVFALERMVTVMVITCPHALGLAIPLVVAMITGLSARNGILIRNRVSFENSQNLDVVVFDKTGTLTKGEFGVTDIVSFGDLSRDELLSRVASIEINSEHTIARGIVAAAKEKGLRLDQVEKFEAIPGIGAKALIKGEEIFVGNTKIIDAARSNLGNASEKLNGLASQGKTAVLVLSKGKIEGVIGLGDIIRDGSKEAVRGLKKFGLEVAMITGDNKATAKYVAEELGIDTFFAEVLPAKKSEIIKELQRQGKKVAMVGDGINDAPALAQADAGIAIGAGTDVAIESADVILVENDPRDVMDVISLSRLTNRKMLQNLAWASGYNIIAIPLAAGVLYNYGIVLTPAIGALLMSLSTVIVAINARLISYKKMRAR